MKLRTVVGATVKLLSGGKWRVVKAGPQPVRAPIPADSTRYFYLGPDVAMTRLQDGHHLFVDPQDETVSTHLIARGAWEPWIHKVVLSLTRPGARVVEVGANVGYYTVAMANKLGPDGRLVTLEANPRLARLVQRSIEFNGYRDRVTVLSQAAADQPGPLTFITSRRNSGGGHSIVGSHGLGDDMVEVQTTAVRLDDLDGPFEFLRMDAEGSEPLILRGATGLLAQPDVVVCMEWDRVQISSRTSPADFAAWLAGLGFSFWSITQEAKLERVAAADLPTLAACDVVMSRHEPRRW